MSEEIRLGNMLGNELGFLWEDNQNQFMSSWANLSNNINSETTGREGEERPLNLEVGKKTNMPPPAVASSGGKNGNITAAAAFAKGKEVAGEGLSSNRKRSRGVVCNNNNNGKSIIINENNDDNNNNNIGGESDHEMHIWTERERRKKMRNMFSNLHALLPQLPSKADKSTIVDEAVNYIKTLEQTLQKLEKQKLEKLKSGSSARTSTSIGTPTNFPSTISDQSSLVIMPNSVNVPQQNKLANYHIDQYSNITREAFLADQGTCINDLAINNNIMGMNSNINNDNNNNTTLPAVPQVVESPLGFKIWTSANVVLNVSGEYAHISVCSPEKPGLFSSICNVLEKYKITVVSAQVSSDGAHTMYMINAHVSRNGGSDQFMEAAKSPEEVFKNAVSEIILWVSA